MRRITRLLAVAVCLCLVMGTAFLVVTGNQHLTGLRSSLGGENTQKGGLTGSVGSEQDQKLTPSDGEVQVPEHRQIAEALAQPLDPDGVDTRIL